MMFSSHTDMIYKKNALQDIDIDIFVAAFFFILVSTS